MYARDYVPDVTDKLDAYMNEQEREAEKLPVCEWCGEHIQAEDCYIICGDIVCPDCIDDCRRSTEDYVD